MDPGIALIVARNKWLTETEKGRETQKYYDEHIHEFDGSEIVASHATEESEDIGLYSALKDFMVANGLKRMPIPARGFDGLAFYGPGDRYDWSKEGITLEEIDEELARMTKKLAEGMGKAAEELKNLPEPLLKWMRGEGVKPPSLEPVDDGTPQYQAYVEAVNQSKSVSR